MHRFFLLLLTLLSFPLFSIITRVVVAFPWPKIIVQYFIRTIFIKGYGVNVEEAEKSPDAYPTIVSFFIRKLKPSTRKINPHPQTIISPVDGRLMDWGKIGNNNNYTVKGKNYILSDLIGEERIQAYHGGNYLILYLSPKEYHRIHHIQTATIKKIELFPGRLFPVNLHSLTHFNNVFGRNKRILIEYKKADLAREDKINKTDAIKRESFIMLLVGALNVGKITLSDFPSFYQDMEKSKSSLPHRYKLSSDKLVSRGDEAGIFYLGSTVILLFKENASQFDLKKDEMFQMGQPLGRWL